MGEGGRLATAYVPRRLDDLVRGVRMAISSPPNPDLLRRARIWSSRPARRDEPLRYANLSDVEVREIQRVTHGVIPDAYVNISGVVTGCPCEDGPACTDQVWVVAYGAGEMKGLQLSRINRHWSIGPVQQWWLDDDALEAYRGRYSSLGQYWAMRAQHEDQFPVCAIAPGQETARKLP
jgi:hypothetical protein